MLASGRFCFPGKILSLARFVLKSLREQNESQEEVSLPSKCILSVGCEAGACAGSKDVWERHHPLV